jgi:hypothetical protein
MADYVVEIDPGATELLTAFAGRENDDEIRANEKATALQALAYVLGKNFGAAEASEKDGVFSLSFKVTWDRNEEPTQVKAVARCSKICTADIELSCQNTN